MILPSASRSIRSLLVVFLIGLGLRLAAIAVLGTARAAEGLGAWSFGHEVACLAQSLREGGFYGDPWGKGTGPSGWLTPVYPALAALCFELGGGVGTRAAWLLFGAQAIASAATALLVGRIARLIARDQRRPDSGDRAAMLGAWIFALHPLAIWYAAHTVWDTTWVALALAALVAVVLDEPGSRGARHSLALGSLSGLALLLNPAVLAALPAILGTELALAERAARWKSAACFCLAALALCLPWMVRNGRVLGSYALRTNLGVELRVGNLGELHGRHDTSLHPSHSDAELDRYRAMGEVEYARWSRDESLRWIGEHPARFLLLCGRRAMQFWLGEPPPMDARTRAGRPADSDPNSWFKWAITLATGVAAWVVIAAGWRRSPTVRVIGAIFLLFPVPYVLTHVSERYRFPIEPLVVALIAAGMGGLSAPREVTPARNAEGTRSRSSGSR